MTSNNDSIVRVFEIDKFEVLQKFSFPWPVNVHAPLAFFIDMVVLSCCVQ